MPTERGRSASRPEVGSSAPLLPTASELLPRLDPYDVVLDQQHITSGFFVVEAAESCEKVKKGLRVLVDGKLDIPEYTDKEGQKRATFRILADACRLL